MRKNKKFLVIVFLLVLLVALVFILIFESQKSKPKKIEIHSEDLDKEYIIVPNGFYYVGGSVNRGVVISDNAEDENKGVSHEAALNMKGNQYVWIPVENVSASNFLRLDNMISDKKYPIAMEDGKNYKGILYDYRGKESKPFIEYSGDYTKGGNLRDLSREPAILEMPIYGDSNEYIDGSTNDLYQRSFNKMVESVKKNKGFYVSRYELSNLHTDNITSKAGQSDISNLSWIEGYNKIKAMYADNEVVSSEMIWGCQWDAIMTWLYNSDENRLYFSKDTSEYCNNSLKSIEPTANKEVYSNKNIYDMIGNVSEFTQEAIYSSLRVARGGSYNYESSITGPTMFTREYYGIVYFYENVGFRSVLIF